jgi:hypothetical protein
VDGSLYEPFSGATAEMQGLAVPAARKQLKWVGDDSALVSIRDAGLHSALVDRHWRSSEARPSGESTATIPRGDAAVRVSSKFVVAPHDRFVPGTLWIPWKKCFGDDDYLVCSELVSAQIRRSAAAAFFRPYRPEMRPMLGGKPCAEGAPSGPLVDAGNAAWSNASIGPNAKTHGDKTGINNL